MRIGIVTKFYGKHRYKISVPLHVVLKTMLRYIHIIYEKRKKARGKIELLKNIKLAIGGHKG